MKRAPVLSLVGLFALASFASTGNEGLSRIELADGRTLFGQFCVSCHGTTARGDGPVAPALRMAVPDLTTLRQRSGGRFPTDRVTETIDGRAVLPAHGTREMPVWGYELEARSAADSPGRATAQALTGRLVEYLRSIQR
jgi:mono/diheme cytochrome c family protein